MPNEIYINITHPANQTILAYLTTGIIFGVAGGTETLALRLPEPERTTALAVPGYGAEHRYPDAVIYAKTIGGDDWALVKLFESVNAEWCRKAHDYSEIAIQPSA
jgi:hypothetical protein